MFKPDQALRGPEKPVEPTLTEIEEEKQIEQETAQSTQIIEQEKVYRQGVVSVLDLIAPAAFDIKPSFVKIGGLYARTLFVMAYPRYISVGWFAPIINYNSSLDIGMFFYPMESELVLKQLKNKVGVLQAQLSSDAEDGKPRDPLRQTALQDIEQLRDDLTQGVEKFFQFALYTTLYAKTEEDLDKLTEDVESVFGSRMVYTKRVFYQAEQGFNSTVPIGNDELMITANLNSSPIASSFPFISSDLTSDNGILYGINRHNNSLIIFDRFSLQNANCTVFATSGAGKSYTIKLEVLRSMMMGTDVIIIDPEKEYKLLSDAVGGTFVNISLNSESKINPFDLPRAVGDSTSVEDIIRSAVINIKGLLKLMIGEWTFQEDTVIDRALIETYAKKDITPESDLAKIEPPLMEDLYQVLDGMEGGADIALRLKKFTSGTFSGLFNAPTNVDMSNQLVIYSVRDLEDELRAMAIYNIVNYVWNKQISPGESFEVQVKTYDMNDHEWMKIISVVDEAWWLMMNDDSARFLHGLVKRGRKYYLGVTTITQDVNDFLGSKYGPGIVNNSALKILMRQSVSSVDIVSKTFDLTKGEKYLLLESNVGEGIFFAGDKHVAIKVVASGLEDSIITSDPKQLLEMEKQKKKQAEEASEA